MLKRVTTPVTPTDFAITSAPIEVQKLARQYGLIGYDGRVFDRDADGDRVVHRFSNGAVMYGPSAKSDGMEVYKVEVGERTISIRDLSLTFAP